MSGGPTSLKYMESGFNKLVYSKEFERYVIARKTLAEIRDQNISFEGKRPLVLFEDIYEALEKALYLYEKGYLPLLGDAANPGVMLSLAKQYGVDSLVSDEASWLKFRKELSFIPLEGRAILK